MSWHSHLVSTLRELIRKSDKLTNEEVRKLSEIHDGFTDLMNNQVTLENNVTALSNELRQIVRALRAQGFEPEGVEAQGTPLHLEDDDE